MVNSRYCYAQVQVSFVTIDYIDWIHISVRVWRPQRKILNTAFNLKILQSFIPIFCEKVQHLVRNLREKEDEDAFDITPMVHACALEMVCGELAICSFFQSMEILSFFFNVEFIPATTLGADIEAQNGKNAEYVEAIGKWVQLEFEPFGGFPYSLMRTFYVSVTWQRLRNGCSISSITLNLFSNDRNCTNNIEKMSKNRSDCPIRWVFQKKKKTVVHTFAMTSPFPFKGNWRAKTGLFPRKSNGNQ